MTLSLNKTKSLKFSNDLKAMEIGSKEFISYGKNYDETLATIKQKGNKKLETAFKQWYWHSDRRFPFG